MKIRFMTYNILFSKAFNELDNILKETKPDILCLQEVETSEANFNRFESLGYALADYSNSFIKFGKIWGVATYYNKKNLDFSRSVIINLRRSIYEMVLFILRGGNKPRTVLDTKFKIKSSKVTLQVFNTHFTMFASNGSRIKQLKETLDDIPRTGTSPFILTGDFNYIPYARKKLESLVAEYGLKEATKDISFTVRYSYDGKYVKYGLLQKLAAKFVSRFITDRSKVDYIFYRNIEAISTKRIDVSYSDHYPIISTFEVKT